MSILVPIALDQFLQYLLVFLADLSCSALLNPASKQQSEKAFDEALKKKSHTEHITIHQALFDPIPSSLACSL